MTVQRAHIPLGEILKSGNRNKILHYERNKTLEKFVQRRGQVSLAWWRYVGLALTGPRMDNLSLSRLSPSPVGSQGWKEHLQRALVT